MIDIEYRGPAWFVYNNYINQGEVLCQYHGLFESREKLLFIANDGTAHTASVKEVYLTEEEAVSEAVRWTKKYLVELEETRRRDITATISALKKLTERYKSHEDDEE